MNTCCIPVLLGRCRRGCIGVASSSLSGAGLCSDSTLAVPPPQAAAEAMPALNCADFPWSFGTGVRDNDNEQGFEASIAGVAEAGSLYGDVSELRERNCSCHKCVACGRPGSEW